MRLSKRPRLLALGGLVVVSALLACVLAFEAGGAKAANGASFTAKSGTLTRIGTSTTIPQGMKASPNFFACSNMTDVPEPVGCPALSGGDSNQGQAPTTTTGVPNTSNTGRAGSGGAITNINGISDDDSHAVNGFHVTPPDQGLCVGAAGPLEAAGFKLGVPGNTSVVIEGVNDAFTVYSKSGAVLYGPDTLVNLFQDPNASGDISCNYDPATQTYFFTEIGVLLSGPDINNYATDLAVVSPNGYAPYQLDTSVGGTCFPDFPQNGFDNNAFYLTVNEFCGNNNYSNASVWAISKSDLVSLPATAPPAVTFGLLSLDGIPVVTLRPAIGDGTSTEYLVNSVPFDAAGNNQPTANTLGLWSVSGDQNIDSDPSSVTLTGQSISSELYAFPVMAASTGDGTTPAGSPSFVIKEPALNPDDSRLEQVQYANGHLYTSLNTALTVGSNPNPVDGAAWFDINPTTSSISQQGYVGLSGTNLLYPSIIRSKSGTLTMDFSMTSPTLNPSTGYTQLLGQNAQGNQGQGFGPVHTTGMGSGPHASFSDLLFNRPRWGDYSAIALDPSGGNVWMADEYVVPTAAPPIDNWGTRVWALTP